MKNLFLINEDEKKRILSLHEKATKKQYLKEDAENMEPEMNQEMSEIDTGMLVTNTIMFGPLGGIIAAFNAGQSGDKARAIFQKCKTSKGKLGKRKMNDSYLAKIADNLNKAVEGLGTDEELIKSSFQSVSSIADLCALSNIYLTRHSENLYDALDGDIDSDREWKKYVFLPLLDNAVKNSTAELNLMKQQAQAKESKLKELGPKAAKCGWTIQKPDGSTVPDVEGYKKSNWECPKGGGKPGTNPNNTKTNTAKGGNSTSTPKSSMINYADYGV